MRALAPYGSYLQQQILKGSLNEMAIIFMGSRSSEKASAFQHLLPYTMYIPANESPFRYEWPLANAEVYLVDGGISGRAFIRHCVACFFLSGAKHVHYITKHTSHTFNKEVSHDK